MERPRSGGGDEARGPLALKLNPAATTRPTPKTVSAPATENNTGLAEPRRRRRRASAVVVRDRGQTERSSPVGRGPSCRPSSSMSPGPGRPVRGGFDRGEDHPARDEREQQEGRGEGPERVAERNSYQGPRRRPRSRLLVRCDRDLPRMVSALYVTYRPAEEAERRRSGGRGTVPGGGSRGTPLTSASGSRRSCTRRS